MDTDKYCKKLNSLSRKKAIQAIHQAYLQLSAMGKTINSREDYQIYDNRPAIKQLQECLKDAGHIGFID